MALKVSSYNREGYFVLRDSFKQLEGFLIVANGLLQISFRLFSLSMTILSRVLCHGFRKINLIIVLTSGRILEIKSE